MVNMTTSEKVIETIYNLSIVIQYQEREIADRDDVIDELRKYISKLENEIRELKNMTERGGYNPY